MKTFEADFAPAGAAATGEHSRGISQWLLCGVSLLVA